MSTTKPDVAVAVKAGAKPALKSNTNTMVWAVVGTLVAVAAGVGGFFIYRAVAAGGGDDHSPPPASPYPSPLPPSPAPPPPAIDITGHWLTNFGSYLSISPTAWYSASSYGNSYYTMVTLNDHYAIMENAPTASYNPSKFRKEMIHETTDSSAWGYCSVVYDADTAADAVAFDATSVYSSADAAAGCNGFGHTTVTPYTSPLVGTWMSNYGAYVTVTADEWLAGGAYPATYSIVAVANNMMVMQNAADASYNPSKYTLVEHHATANGAIAHCMSKYDMESAGAALTADTSAIYNSSDAATGCGGFGFTTWTSYAMPLVGTWDDNWGSTLVVTATTWDGKAMKAYGSNYAIFQYPATDQYNPSKWAKVEWHAQGAGYGYCTSIYNANTAAEALKTDTSSLYNTSDATSGCSGFGHTVITAAAGR